MAEESSPLSKLPIEIHGICYHLCFDLDALAEAEDCFTRQGHGVALFAIVTRGMDEAGLGKLLACALHRHHPELGFVEARNLGNAEALCVVAIAMPAAFKSAPAESKEAFCLRTFARRLPTGIADA